jgi:outer membrane protein OmpA-like peptidoglycan-associated protein/tetratricopeptide (TPR) repeat protein
MKSTLYTAIKLSVLTIAFTAANSIFAQNIEFTKENFKEDKDGLKLAKENIEKGDEFFNAGTPFYRQAIDPYLAANNFNPNNALLNYKLGQCYLYSNFKLKAIPHLEKAYKLNPSIDSYMGYFMGRAYQLDMQWDKAIKEYTVFQKTLNMSEDGERYEEVNKFIKECYAGKELSQKPIRVFIDNIGGDVNSQFSDYGPVISADESILLFTSRRPNTIGGKVDPQDNNYFEDIYITTKTADGKWSKAENMGEPVNSSDHDANSGLSADGTKFLVYIGKNNGDLYESTLIGDKWSKPEALNKNINTDKYHESSACYSPDGNALYFVTDKPGGFGDRDIYVSNKDAKGKWGEAVNLGPVINTKYGEEAVYIHPDGKTLYFSSQGHKSMGGFDIFKSVYNDSLKVWSTPENIGYPVNTPDDDVFLVVSASGKRGYYTSFNPNGFGEKDLYMITFLGPEKPMAQRNEDNLIASQAAPVKETVVAPVMEIKEAQLTILKGVITDALTTKPLEATIEIIDNQANQVIASFTSNSATGKYLVSLPAGKNYGIAVKKEGYLFHSENFDIPNTAAFQQVEKDVELKKVAVGSKIILKNIFFDFDKATLRPESTNELQRLTKLLNDVPTMKIEISGHTDSKGANDYNLKLSDNRAKAVVDYLIKAGIPANRLVYKGYGEEQPIATNETDEGRQLNRRTEFKILSM